MSGLPFLAYFELPIAISSHSLSRWRMKTLDSPKFFSSVDNLVARIRQVTHDYSSLLRLELWSHPRLDVRSELEVLTQLQGQG